MNHSRGVLVASLPPDLDLAVLADVRRDLLLKLGQSDTRGVVIDLSAVELLGLDEFASLRGTERMLGLMGSSVIWVALKPGIVSSLIDLDADVAGIRATLSLDDALDDLALEHYENAGGQEPEEHGDAPAPPSAEPSDG